MLKIINSGCTGKMGQVVQAICAADPDVTIVAGFATHQDNLDYPVYTNPANFTGEADVVIDFSNPKALDHLLPFCVERCIPIVIATTGFSPAGAAGADRRGRYKTIPVFRSADMSLGINVLLELVKKAASILGSSSDIEIVERHHNRKVDAPSGTALMIADAAPLPALEYKAEYNFGRHERRMARPKNEIGISAVRGGTIVGDHTIIFAGHDEVIEIKHSAQSREIFANGAVKAAKFLADVQEAGMYDMSQLVNE